MEAFAIAELQSPLRRVSAVIWRMTFKNSSCSSCNLSWISVVTLPDLWQGHLTSVLEICSLRCCSSLRGGNAGSVAVLGVAVVLASVFICSFPTSLLTRNYFDITYSLWKDLKGSLVSVVLFVQKHCSYIHSILTISSYFPFQNRNCFKDCFAFGILQQRLS